MFNLINFIHPAPGSITTSPFGSRPDPFNPKKTVNHKGIDYAKSGNVPILASADGVVKQYIGDGTTYGKVLFITHMIDGKQMDTTYAHLKSKLVKAGDKVKQGQIIGYMGNTGASTGQHLHFEIHNGAWKSGQPNAVNPANYVDKKSTTMVNPNPSTTIKLKSVIGTVTMKSNLNVRETPSLTGKLKGTVDVWNTYNVYEIIDNRFYDLGVGYISNPDQKYGTFTPIKVDKTYTVKSGDTLSKIAKSLNVTTSYLTTKNNIANANNIKVGQILKY